MKKENLETLLLAYEECKYPYHMLNALEKISETETNLIKKLECIPDEIKKEWEDVNSLAYDCAAFDDKWFKDYFNFALTVTVYPYFITAVSDLHDSEEEELLLMRVIPDLAKTLKELFVLETELERTNPKRRNKVKITNQLLEITDAVLMKASNYWKYWKSRAEEITERLPLEKILDTFHSLGIRGMDDVIKLLLPDAVTSLLFHINFTNVFFNELQLLANGIEKRQYSNKVLKKILNAMGKESLYKTDRPLEEQLMDIYSAMIFIYWSVKDKTCK